MRCLDTDPGSPPHMSPSFPHSEAGLLHRVSAWSKGSICSQGVSLNSSHHTPPSPYSSRPPWGLPESPSRHHSLILPNPSLSAQRNGSVIDECKHCPEKIIKIHGACAASAVGVASAASVISEIINDCACLISLEVSGAGKAGCHCLCPRGTGRVFISWASEPLWT